jgi:hypothetical protein
VTGGAVLRARIATVPVGAPWWLAAIVVLTVIGFQASVTRAATPIDWAHALHGITALGWSMTLVAQAWLAEQRRREAHRLVAVAGMVFGIGLVSTAFPMLASLAAGASANPAFRRIGLRLLAMDCLLLTLFTALLAVAVAFVRRPAVHARAISATGLLALPASLGRRYMRVLSVDPMRGSYLALGTAAMLLVGLIIADRRAGVRDRVHPLVLAAVVAVSLLVGVTADAHWFAAWARQVAGV